MTPPTAPAPRRLIARREFLRLSAASAAGLMLGACRHGPSGPRIFAGFRFGLITDIHYGDAAPKGTHYYRESLGKVREAVDRFESGHARFLVELGDLLQDTSGDQPEARTLANLAAVERELRRFDGATYHVLGNHDLDNLSKAQVLAAITNTDIAPGRSFYAYNTGGVRFFVTDDEFLHDGRGYDHGNYDWRDANVPPAELDWLRVELAATDHPVIVFGHQRLDGEGDVQVANRTQVREILEESGKVVAVFQGHDHKGAYSFINGIHYYTLKGVIEGSGPQNNAYAIVDVHRDLGITVTGYRQAVSMDLPYRQPGMVGISSET
jgi:3',5'-cyclic AMP phosphodiesterase CpdA